MECLQSLKMVIDMYIATPVMQEFHTTKYLQAPVDAFHRKTTRSKFKSCKVGELQHSSKENEEGTSLPDETLDLAQLPHPYSAQGDTDPKSQYKHQVEQQGLARKEDLPDEPSSLDALPHDNEGSKEDPKETTVAKFLFWLIKMGAEYVSTVIKD